MTWVEAIILITLLVIIQQIYFRIAEQYQLVDHPNHRSSHQKATIRGGGIIIPLGVLGYSLSTGIEYPYLISGLVIITIISLIDDLGHLPPILRIIGQGTGMFLLFLEITGSETINLPVVLLFIIAVGVLNSYNFMDGINGIMASYSLVLLITIFYIQNYLLSFKEPGLVLTTFLGIIVFTYYNFRTKARCFAGDVGSVGMAFIAVFFVGQLIHQTGTPIWILLLAVLGTDSVLTIVHRLIKKENIFEAHRSHLYQYYANEKGSSHLEISLYYALVQLVINSLLVINFQYSYLNEWVLAAIILVPLALFYIFRKRDFELRLTSSIKNI